MHKTGKVITIFRYNSYCNEVMITAGRSHWGTQQFGWAPAKDYTVW